MVHPSLTSRSMVLCASENVECIVVNDRHTHNMSIKELLDKCVEKNKRNLIWMQPESTTSHPSAATSIVRGSALHASSYPGPAGLTLYAAVTSV